MKRHNVFITEEETAELKELLQIAQSTPVIALSTAHALESGGFAGDAWSQVKERAHKIALSHGLPEIPGYYGVDLESREILSA